MVAIPKCGGKAQCFDKPGPTSKFKMSVRANAQSLAAQAQVDGGTCYACVASIIASHDKEAWRKRATRDIEKYVRAAQNGTRPGLVSSGCECRKGTPHHIFCKKNDKVRAEDRNIMHKIEKELRVVAAGVVQVGRHGSARTQDGVKVPHVETGFA